MYSNALPAATAAPPVTQSGSTQHCASSGRRVDAAHVMGQVLTGVRQTGHFQPQGTTGFVPVNADAPAPADANSEARITSPGTSDYHVTCFAFQTLCDIAREAHEALANVRGLGGHAAAGSIKCAVLGRILESRMRTQFGVQSFSVDIFAGITGLASLLEEPPTLAFGSPEALVFDVRMFRTSTGLDAAPIDASTPLTRYGHEVLRHPDGLPVLDVIHALHKFMWNPDLQPSLPFIRGDNHRRLCRQYWEAGLAEHRNEAPQTPQASTPDISSQLPACTIAPARSPRFS